MKQRVNWHWFEIGLLILSIAAHLYIATRPVDSLMKWYDSDDGFYYFKVAENISNGQGVTFDGINPTNGFHPLWMLVCIPVFALARFDPVLPLRLLVLISGLLNAGTAILIFRLLSRYISRPTAALMGVFWAFLPSIYLVVVRNGMESTISAFFLALLFYMAVLRRGEKLGFRQVISLGMVAGLAVLARLDNIFVVMLIGLWFVFGPSGGYLRTLVVGDLALIFIVGLLSYYFRLTAGPTYIAHSVSLPWHLALGFVLIPLSLFLFGLYRTGAEKFSWKFMARCILAVTLASGLMGALLLVFQRAGLFHALPRSVILVNFAGNLLCVTGLRLLAGYGYRNEAVPEDVPLRSWAFWKIIIPRASGYYLLLGLLLGIYMLWSYLYVGTPMPVSGQIKHWWGGLSTVYGSAGHILPELMGLAGKVPAWGLATSLEQFLQDNGGPFSQSVLALKVAGILGIILPVLLIPILVLQRKWVVMAGRDLGLFAIFLGLYAHIFSYTSTSYIHIRIWYWTGEFLFTIVCLGILLESIYLALKQLRIRPRLWQAATGFASLLILVSFGYMISAYYPFSIPPEHQGKYLAETRAVESTTELGALIGSTGGGKIGYFIKDRTIVNMDGLINSPEYFKLLKFGQATVLLDQIGLDYVLGNGYMLTSSDPYMQTFTGHLEKITDINVDGTTLYRYIPTQNGIK